ncbi:hypothetical protein PPTG_01058 [Phytophthora nicotianae INRA-310]|uniref:Uncharacterized protein n=1 Tax=Phytophthora nicotianae (strain INRA-310) TaxID=761204 RepID=W2RJV2_PHYN3|nr:hypothetical protein PPTG_01058 [Phytophthora nicotianae INRA-310]ETN24885.1 hypothetical protein PPTG_01058 [Phytophthora nicotianae INRA-310]
MAVRTTRGALGFTSSSLAKSYEGSVEAVNFLVERGFLADDLVAVLSALAFRLEVFLEDVAGFLAEDFVDSVAAGAALGTPSAAKQNHYRTLQADARLALDNVVNELIEVLDTRGHAVNPEMRAQLVPVLPLEGISVVGGRALLFAIDSGVEKSAEPLQLGGRESSRHGGSTRGGDSNWEGTLKWNAMKGINPGRVDARWDMCPTSGRRLEVHYGNWQTMERWLTWAGAAELREVAGTTNHWALVSSVVAGIIVWVVTTPLRNVSWAFLDSVVDSGRAIYFFVYTCGDRYLEAARNGNALALPPLECACSLISLAFLIPIAVL